ncbi:MAG: 1-acyl-sn-glycerol-3-phosphate acyltransferase, partial [Clostridia bacterium]|nr:1-acyl-sn-glycerol-3-phosphate acyltransferase [Clostridia bacterium]
CLCGVFLGNTIIYLAYKYYGDSLKKYFQKNIDLDFEKLRTSKRMILFVLLLYFCPAIPYGLICFFTASLNTKYTRYIILTTLGAIPSIMIGVGLGHMAVSASWIISLIVFVILVVLIIILAVKRKQLFEKINKMIHKSHEPYKSDTVVKNHKGIVLFLEKIIFSLIIKRKFKFSYKINAKVKGPCIVLCNHGSFYDFLFTSLMLKKQRPHFIAARLYFYHRRLAWLLRFSGVFPKSMFSNDIENIQNCLRVIKGGKVLVMMPEARLSTVGKFEGIQDTTIKFIKKMGVPVYTINLYGDYLACPKWGDKTRRKSVVKGELNQLFTAEEIQNTELDLVNDKICKTLNYDEFKWLEQNPEICYNHPTIAVGLENILSRCPKCNSEFSLKTQGNTITCEHCDLQVQVDNRYQLSGVQFKTISEWYEWQTQIIKQQILDDPEYKLTSRVELKHQSYDGKQLLRTAGFGECTLDRSGLTYVGTIDGQEVVKKFDMKIIYRILFGAGEDFEIYEGKQLYFFVPEDTRSAVKWYAVSEILKEDCNE